MIWIRFFISTTLWYNHKIDYVCHLPLCYLSRKLNTIIMSSNVILKIIIPIIIIIDFQT